MIVATEPTIALQDLHKYYGEGETRLHVLKGLDLEVMPGEYLAITGPSGSGKSTLLNILGCLDRPTEGKFLLDGHDVSRHSDDQLSTIRNEKLGFIFQSFNLIPQLTVLENVGVPRMYHSSGEDWMERAREILERVRLSERLGHRPAQLSGGERQRVAIARSLINNPLVLFADEPTGNLDTKTGEEVLGLLDELHAEGRTIVMITHDPEVAAGAERGIHIRDGLIAERT